MPERIDLKDEGVVDEVRFAADLYRGTAEYYDRYRRPYPEAMIEDLIRRSDIHQHGRRWLKPGGYLAVCWSPVPWGGEEDWQRAFSATLDKWQAALGAQDRVPAGWDLPRKNKPDLQLLAEAGFEAAGGRELPVEYRWSLPELAGYVRSTSFLPAAVLGEQAAAFDADLAASLAPYGDGGSFTENASCAYELAHKPA